jgi:segregation and condensation protein B
MNPLTQNFSLSKSFGSEWRRGEHDGNRWSFFARHDQNTPLIIVIEGTSPECVRTPKMARAEAVLLLSDTAISAKRLVQLATLADVGDARQIVDQLNRAYDLDASAFRIEHVAGGFRLLTKPLYSFWLGKLHQRQAELKLTPPALETLAIVAYRQPLTRADVEAIRRVQCTDMLKQLMDRGLVRIAGEDDSLGRPFLYETTRLFLELFGLRSLDALPMAESLRKQKAKLAVTPDTEPGDSDSAESTESAARLAISE